MNNFLGLELPASTAKPSFFNNTHINSFLLTESLSPTPTTFFPPQFKYSSNKSKYKRGRITSQSSKSHTTTSVQASDIATAQVEEQVEVEVAEGYTITQFIDKIIEVFLKEKPQTKEWRKYLVFREEWNKYREGFYKRCRMRADVESDPTMKQKLISLGRKVKKIDDEMEGHSELLKEIQDSPTDINAIVARRRKDFTGEFFRYLTLLSETYDSLEDHDAVARLGARCLSAVSAYDNTLEHVDTLDVAQAKFDDILNSPSVEVACEKIKSLAKTKELDSSLILLINSAWASAKESTTMKNEVKDIMYHLYKATKSSLRSIAPQEIKLLKHLLNITDPEERFSALATAFSPGDDHEAKDPNALYTTPKELHKWIKIMLDAYNLSKEDTDIREVKQMTQPIVIQRLFILKETIEQEYMEHSSFQDSKTEGTTKSEEL
ncbi:endoribonuclease E-like protein [Fagus crenata]